MRHVLPSALGAAALLCALRKPSGLRAKAPKVPAWRASLSDDVWAAVQRARPDKYPANDIDPSTLVVDLSDPCTASILTWRDTKGKQQSGYAPCFSAAARAKKWARVKRLGNKRTDISERVVGRGEREPVGARAREAYVAAAIIAETGARPGSAEMSRGSRGNDPRFGITTLQAHHVTDRRPKGAQPYTALHFLGKNGVENTYRVYHPQVRSMLRQLVRAARKRGGLSAWVFPHANPKDVNAAFGRGFTAKDFRTVRGSKLATKLLTDYTPPPLSSTPTKAECNRVRGAFAAATKPVAAALSNTPAVARERYIAPPVYEHWLGQDDAGCEEHLPRRPNGQPW